MHKLYTHYIMKYVQMTKLVSGYIPTRVWVNPQAVIYVEEHIERRSQGGDKYVEVPKGSRIRFQEGAWENPGFIDVQEPPETVVCLLSGLPRESVPDSYEAWEAERERIADAVYGPLRG